MKLRKNKKRQPADPPAPAAPAAPAVVPDPQPGPLPRLRDARGRFVKRPAQ